MERAKKLQELEQANVLAEIEAMMGGGDEKSKKSKGKIKANSTTSNKGSESQTPMFGRKQSSESASKNSKKASINEK